MQKNEYVIRFEFLDAEGDLHHRIWKLKAKNPSDAQGKTFALLNAQARKTIRNVSVTEETRS